MNSKETNNSKKYCPNCGAAYTGSPNFCQNCGKTLKENMEESEELRTFLYVGFDEKSRKNTKGRITAKDRTEANKKLREKGILVEYLREEKEKVKNRDPRYESRREISLKKGWGEIWSEIKEYSKPQKVWVGILTAVIIITLGFTIIKYMIPDIRQAHRDYRHGRSILKQEEIKRLKILEENKDFAIKQIKAYPGVKDADFGREGRTLSLAIIVDSPTSRERAKELGESFVRLVKTFCEENPPGNEIGETYFDYIVGVYYPGGEEIVLGAKARTARRITW